MVVIIDLVKNELPMKKPLSDQFNLRIERELKEDIVFLDRAGVEVSNLVRPILRELIRNAKKQIEKAG